MFFLLAAFMLVSLTMINMKGIDVNLPTATSAQPNEKPDFTMVSIDALMDIYFDKEKVSREDVLPRFQAVYNSNHNARVFIRADKDATYESVVYVLDKARTAGIQKVGLEIKAYDSGAGSEAKVSGLQTAPATPAKAQSTPVGFTNTGH
ncbi:MAG: biopolymer transporter ExbD [Verrucomicrobia bacterium]|nr:biopolymer transporter ExbD [Verrucomicrobiota bacterium]